MKRQGLVTSPASRKFLQFATHSIKDTIGGLNRTRNLRDLHQKRVVARALKVKKNTLPIKGTTALDTEH